MERPHTQSQGVTRSFGELTEAFLLSKQVSGCTEATLATYHLWLNRFQDTIGSKPDVLSVHKFFANLQERGFGPQSLHQGYRRIGAFLRWCSDVGELPGDLMKGLHIRTPKTLPQVPTEEELRKVLQQCSNTLIGKRHRALLLTLADSGLRASEALHLLVENWNPSDRSLFIRCGKGRKDRVTFLSPTTARAIRDYLGMRVQMAPEDFLFVDASSQPLKRRHLIQILHRLSEKAGLPPHRRLHPHSLRHFAATSWLRNGVGLDEVRRLLGHESLNTTLRYSSLVASDLQHAHKKAAAIERMRLG
jgi:integrase/recombinase XerD